MNRAPFFRKVGYLALIALLLLPLYWLAQPSTVAVEGRAASPGGLLAQKRNEYKIGQANLGKIDPTGETIRLATLGMRGVAATILSAKADDYKMKEDWTSLSATLEQLAYLQPNYVGTWQFQSWNLSYNIAAEWDDYRDRYFWVMKGIEYLQKGIEYNQNEPRLLSSVGWFAAQKIGRSDEHLLFRRLFRDDDDFHRRQAIHERDNWLFAKAYFLAAERAVELGATMPAASTPVFYSRPAVAESNRAEALEDDHAQALIAAASHNATSSDSADLARRIDELDERYRQTIPEAWRSAAMAWRELGAREFPGALGEPYRLHDRDAVSRALAASIAELERLAPGSREAVHKDKLARLPTKQREALDLSEIERTEEQKGLANLAERDTQVSYLEMAERAPEAERAQARSVAERATAIESLLFEIARGRENINFDSWQTRCRMEQSAEARDARRWLHRAAMDFTAQSDLPSARQNYERAFAAWRKVLDAYPDMLTDQTEFAILDAIHQYETVLKQMDLPFPKKFVLQELLDNEDKVR